MLEAYIKERSLAELEARLPEETVEVRQILDSLTKDQPFSAQAISLLARCELLSGNISESKQLFEQLLAYDPANLSAKVELAKIFHGQNETGMAIGLLTEVTNARPDFDENWSLLGEYLKQDGQEQASINALKQYDMIKAFNDHLQSAEQAFTNADYAKADKICRFLLEQVPNELRALRLLASIAKQFRHYEISTSLLARCVATRPGDATLGVDYAQALLASKDFRAAVDQCDRVIGFAPEAIDIFSVKAEALYNLGQYEKAIEIFRSLTDAHVNPELSMLHLGKLLKTVGKTKEAISYFHQVTESEKVFGQAYWELANLKTYRFSEVETETMRRLLSTGELSTMNRILIQFSFGKALEDSKQFAESFQQYQSANSAYTRTQPYRYASHNARHKSFYDQDYFSAQRPNGNDSNAPIFVVGLPRSGSTLVEQMLTSHSQVDSTMELTGITSISRGLNSSTQPGKGQYPQSVADLSADQVQELAQGYLNDAAPYRFEAPHFVDKSPANFQHIGLIKTLFPNAKIIDIRRHPMASGWSLYRHFFADSFMFSYDLATIGKYFNDYIELMDHWHTVLPGQILTLNYEDLVKDLPNKLDVILQYCDLEFEDDCLNFHLNKRAVATPSSEQVRQPIYADALEHWKNYETFLSPLKEAIKSIEFSD